MCARVHAICVVIGRSNVETGVDFYRFMTAEGTSKNRIVSPGKIMHFYNAPPDSSEETIHEV